MSKVIAVVCLAVLAFPAAARAQAPEVVAGSGTFDFGIGPGLLTFAVQERPEGAAGHIRVDVADTAFADLQADVQCATVSADRAVIGAVLLKPVVLRGYVYTHLVIYVEDSGRGATEPDVAYAALRMSEVDCGMFEPFAVYPAEQGNVVIGGAAAPPPGGHGFMNGAVASER